MMSLINKTFNSKSPKGGWGRPKTWPTQLDLTSAHHVLYALVYSDRLWNSSQSKYPVLKRSRIPNKKQLFMK